MHRPRPCVYVQNVPCVYVQIVTVCTGTTRTVETPQHTTHNHNPQPTTHNPQPTTTSTTTSTTTTTTSTHHSHSHSHTDTQHNYTNQPNNHQPTKTHTNTQTPTPTHRTRTHTLTSCKDNTSNDRFRDVQVCNNLVTDEIDDHRIQSDYKCIIGLQYPEGKNSTHGIAYAW